MDQTKMNNFSKALLAAERALELFEGGPEDSHEFHVKADSSAGTLTIKEYTIFLRDGGPSRVLAGNLLVGSYSDPVEAVVEAMGKIIADRTKSVLWEFLGEESGSQRSS
jgi:hypothetical protein